MIVLTIPNLLTGLRLVLIPVFAGIFFVPGWGYQAAALVFALASLTDWADGFLARRLGQYSAFGEFLDPVADKLLVSVALVLLVWRDSNLLLLAAACIIVGREIAISALREWLANATKPRRLAVSWLGKLKTLLQLVAVMLLLWASPHSEAPLYLWGLGMLGAAAAMTLISMAYYLRLAWGDAAPSS